MANLAFLQKRTLNSQLKEFERSIAYTNHSVKDIIRDLLNSTASKEAILGNRDDVFGDPESFLCIMRDAEDGCFDCPAYVYGLKIKDNRLMLMVMFSNGDTEEILPELDVFESLFLAKQLIDKL